MAIVNNLLLASLAMLFSANASASGIPIVEVSAAQRMSLQDPVLLALSMDPASASIRIIDARPALLDATTPSLQLDLGDFRINVDAGSRSETASGSVVWEGTVREGATAVVESLRMPAIDPANSITLVRHGDKLTGNLRVHGQLFQIRPLADGRHALVEVNEEMMPAEHPEASMLGADAIDMTLSRSGHAVVPVRNIQPVAGYGNTVISVMVVATRAAAEASGDIAALTDLAIAESNRGYANSGVRITLELAGLYITDYVESGSFSTDLSRFRGNGDGYMDQFHAARDGIGADVNMLLIDNSTSCGLASAFAANADAAFAAVHWNCATGSYSFAHEIGHLLGARHDAGSDAASTPYVYGHGYRYTPTSGEGWRTVMALDCPVSCARLNFWSNPEYSYRGLPMGNANSNNASVLMQGGSAMSSFRSSPGSGNPLARTVADVR